uniref:RING-type domain-containing protein n=1 Tax=Nymphaea colorata TaxID=210225 RepID=A0A5K1A4W9_9MAGN
MHLSPLILLFNLQFSLAEEETPISSKISSYFVVFFLLLCAVLLKYIVHTVKLQKRDSSRDSNDNIVNVEVGDLQEISVGTPQQSSGRVDRNLINSLQVFEFAALTESSIGSECAIFLGRFEDKDLLHLLPKCRQAFHRECIDK